MIGITRSTVQLRESSFQEHKEKAIKESSAASSSAGLCMEEARKKLKEIEEGLWHCGLD
jgi:hypothetical protein